MKKMEAAVDPAIRLFMKTRIVNIVLIQINAVACFLTLRRRVGMRVNLMGEEDGERDHCACGVSFV